jgi:hypothetical protein
MKEFLIIVAAVFAAAQLNAWLTVAINVGLAKRNERRMRANLEAMFTKPEGKPTGLCPCENCVRRRAAEARIN